MTRYKLPNFASAFGADRAWGGGAKAIKHCES